MSQGAAPPPPGVVPNFEHPQDVLHTINLATQILSLILVSCFSLLRLYAKTVVSPPFYLDDWFSILAWILSLSYASTALVMARHGGGYHVYEITKEDLIGFYKVNMPSLQARAKLTSFLGLYADTLVYGPNSFFTKVTLILMVTRVFATSRKTVIVGYIFMFLMLCYYLPVLIIKAQICRPIEGYWDQTVHAKCFNQRAVFIADTLMSALSDTAVLCLPIPIAMTLRMTWQKRLKVMVMLSAGGVATAFSIVRMVLVFQLQGSTDDPVDFIRFNLLGTAEVSIGVICGCFPAVNILMRYRCPSPDSSQRSSSSGPTIKFLFGSRLRTQRLTNAPPAETTLGTTTLQGDLVAPAGGGGDTSQAPSGPLASHSRSRQQRRGSERSSSALVQPETPTSPPPRRGSLPHQYNQARRGSERSSSALVPPEMPTSPARRGSLLRQDQQRRGSGPVLFTPRSPGSPTFPVRGAEECIFPIERRLSLAALAQQQDLEGGGAGGNNGGAAGRSATPLEPPREDPWYELVTSPTFDGPYWREFNRIAGWTTLRVLDWARASGIINGSSRGATDAGYM